MGKLVKQVMTKMFAGGGGKGLGRAAIKQATMVEVTKQVGDQKVDLQFIAEVID